MNPHATPATNRRSRALTAFALSVRPLTKPLWMFVQLAGEIPVLIV
jgi:hypothetical protein